jgi:hypothetical protein
MRGSVAISLKDSLARPVLLMFYTSRMLTALAEVQTYAPKSCRGVAFNWCGMPRRLGATRRNI